MYIFGLLNFTLTHFKAPFLSFPESGRKSTRASRSKLRADMISRPQNDLRHTGHIGYDGAVFGDVSFIGDNYDKLPVKVVNPCKSPSPAKFLTCSYHEVCYALP